MPGKQMLAIEMGKAGYETAMIGKWHLKVEPGDFDYYCVLRPRKVPRPSFRVRGDKPWGKNLIEFPDKHSTDAITDLHARVAEGKKQGQALLPHAPLQAPRLLRECRAIRVLLGGRGRSEPETLWKRHPKFGSLATRGNDDELIPHVGTSIGNRNPRRSYLRDLPGRFPKEFPQNYDPANHSDEENTRLAYNAYLKKFLRCVKGIDDNLGRLFKHLEQSGQMDDTSSTRRSRFHAWRARLPGQAMDVRRVHAHALPRPLPQDRQGRPAIRHHHQR